MCTHNFFLKLVLPVILKELQSICLISTLRLLQQLSQKIEFVHNIILLLHIT